MTASQSFFANDFLVVELSLVVRQIAGRDHFASFHHSDVLAF